MSAFDRFEKRVERFFDGAFAKAFRTEVKPVEIASALRREMDDRAAVLSRGRTVVPNEFSVVLSPTDIRGVEEWGADALAEEMVAAITEHAASQEYSLVGPVRVSFHIDDDLDTGAMQVRSATKRGAVAPVTTSATPVRHPIIDIDGQQYLLTGAVTIIGRGTEADLVVDDSGVSRRHLEITVTPRGTIARDLGSTNGTFVNGERVTSARLNDGDRVTIGRISFTVNTRRR